MTTSISRFPLPETLDALPPDVRERILAVQAKAGFVPNVFLMLAHRPDEFRAFFAYHDALMERVSDTLTQAEKEMVVVAVSAEHGCLYCVVAHGAILRILAKNPLIADQIAVNHRTAEIGARQRRCSTSPCIWPRAAACSTTPGRRACRASGVQPGRHLGHRRVAALFGLSNRLVSTGAHAAERRVLPDRPRAQSPARLIAGCPPQRLRQARSRLTAAGH